MTPSEKPERAASQPQQDANPSTVSTQTVDQSAQRTGASSTGQNPSEDSAPAEGGTDTAAADSASRPSGGEATEAPPPWQRATVAGASMSSASPSPETPGGHAPDASPGPSFPGTSEEDDTQTIPRQVQDQETVRTALPTAEGPSVAESARASVSFPGGGSARPGGSSGSSAARRPSSRGPRRASLQVKRVDPWSVLKLALVLSVALFFAWMIAVAVLYGVLDGMGVWEVLNGTFTDLAQPDNAPSEPLISAGRVFGVAAIIGGINIVLLTALATVGAFVYNVAADFAGGMEVTLSERE